MGESRPRLWPDSANPPSPESDFDAIIAESAVRADSNYEQQETADAYRDDGEPAPGEPVEDVDIDATDAAIRTAEDHGIDLATITGTGADGRITKDDVDRALAGG